MSEDYKKIIDIINRTIDKTNALKALSVEVGISTIEIFQILLNIINEKDRKIMELEQKK